MMLDGADDDDNDDMMMVTLDCVGKLGIMRTVIIYIHIYIYIFIKEFMPFPLPKYTVFLYKSIAKNISLSLPTC